jgi:hypothetical protein
VTADLDVQTGYYKRLGGSILDETSQGKKIRLYYSILNMKTKMSGNKLSTSVPRRNFNYEKA